MYESTPQHVIDEESHPGVLADMLNSSTSSDSSSSSGSDSDDSSGSNTTAKKIKRAFRGRRRRKSSVSSKEAPSLHSNVQTPSDGTFNDAIRTPSDPSGRTQLSAIASGDEADDDERHRRRRKHTRPKSNRQALDQGNRQSKELGPEPGSGSKSPEVEPKKKSKKRRKRKEQEHRHSPTPDEKANTQNEQGKDIPRSLRVAFVNDVQTALDASPRRSFTIRNFSSVRPAMPKMLNSTVFSTAYSTGPAAAPTTTVPAVPRAPYGLRRATSLPDRLNKASPAPPAQPMQRTSLNRSSESVTSVDSSGLKHRLSHISAVILLVVSTALVALCAEYLVDSINFMVDNTDVSEAFIGLIILPIVGNAAEHITAVTVASKNKMDLAIGVAVGSSIQVSRGSFRSKNPSGRLVWYR